MKALIVSKTMIDNPTVFGYIQAANPLAEFDLPSQDWPMLVQITAPAAFPSIADAHYFMANHEPAVRVDFKPNIFERIRALFNGESLKPLVRV